MNRRAFSFVRVLVSFGALIAAGTLAACSDKLEAGNACPLLCPQENVELRDTVLDASVISDSSFPGYPPLGSETYLLLANLGDTLDTRVVVRYDTLPTKYRDVAQSVDSTITQVDSARLNIRVLALPTTRTAPFTIEAYDVDTVATDTAAAPILALFRPDRFLGSETFTPDDSLTDTLRISIPNAFLLARIQAVGRIRIGLRVTSPESMQIRVLSTGLAQPMSISFRATPDTTTARVVVGPQSRTPADQPFIRDPLADYVVVARGALPSAPRFLAVGGYPANRTYLRFDIPRRITDSSTVIRASLVLTQAPNAGSANAKDTLTVNAFLVLAGNTVTDLSKAVTFLADGLIDSLRVVPSDSGEKRLELVRAIRSWRGVDPALTPRAIGIMSSLEAERPASVLFFAREAGDDVRPRLQITYVPSISLGLP